MTAVSDLVAVVDRLLDPVTGCVWNREQTHASLARYAVEESYELVDAIDSGDDVELREELGDVLYQVVLHAGLAASFDLEDVAADARDKMVRRHPHVFGDERADTVEEVVRVWRAAKAAEKSDRRSAFDGVPRAMPPLERAVKLLERLEERGDADRVVASVLSAGSSPGSGPVPEDRAARAVPDGSGVVDVSWGATVLGSVAAARDAGIDPIASLRAAVTALEDAGRAGERA
ncbi:MazG nucleotide pyrophosphohydrolase domain-containing protein [Curtobacterium sp. L1-20]|uniref:MazG nucleotide pyrophosphohydrolase domain-containing protein n=1 Tax=Curtobacterium sp. L1-20 TaxID=3138181 RepID=UPI003B51952E